MKGSRQAVLRPITVYMIGDQSYGSHHLARLLKRDRRIRIFHESHGSSRVQWTNGAETVFVLDAGGG